MFLFNGDYRVHLKFQPNVQGMALSQREHRALTVQMATLLCILSWLLLSSHVWASMPDLKEDAVDLSESMALLDQGCMQLKEHGPCAIGEIPGVWISYFEPSLVIKTIAAKASSNSISGGNLQFYEVHVYDFPLKQMEQMALCGSLTNNAAGLRFISELDQPLWRTETKRASGFIGNWGPINPSTGFINHYSKAVSSGLAALRGMNAAWVLSGHRAEAPLLFRVNKHIDKVQLIKPQQGMCMAPGTDLRLWQSKSVAGEPVSKEGKFVWIYWKFTQCCKTAVPIPTAL